MIRVLAFFLVLLLQPDICLAQQNGSRGQEKGHSRIWLGAASKLTILVTTNVDAFPCEYKSSVRSDTIEFEYLTKDHQNVEIENASLRFPLSLFDCGQKIKNKEFGQLLNKKDYEHIIINLNGLRIYQDDSHGILGKFLTSIEVAGQVRSEEIDILDILSNHNSSIYSGSVTINIREYGLEPPVKFLGLIKVNELVKIDFEFRFLSIP